MGFMTLQVSEVHMCADVAGWELSLDDARAFISRGHRRKTHLDLPDDHQDQDQDSSDEAITELPAIELTLRTGSQPDGCSVHRPRQRRDSPKALLGASECCSRRGGPAAGSRRRRGTGATQQTRRSRR